MNSYLIFKCPYCNYKYKDELELLDDDVLHDVRCESCSEPFRVLTKGCAACGKDTTIVWRETPSEDVISSLHCRHCGKLLHKLEDSELNYKFFNN